MKTEEKKIYYSPTSKWVVLRMRNNLLQDYSWGEDSGEEGGLEQD